MYTMQIHVYHIPLMWAGRGEQG